MPAGRRHLLERRALGDARAGEEAQRVVVALRGVRGFGLAHSRLVAVVLMRREEQLERAGKVAAQDRDTDRVRRDGAGAEALHA